MILPLHLYRESWSREPQHKVLCNRKLGSTSISGWQHEHRGSFVRVLCQEGAVRHTCCIMLTTYKSTPHKLITSAELPRLCLGRSMSYLDMPHNFMRMMQAQVRCTSERNNDGVVRNGPHRERPDAHGAIYMV